MKPMEPKSPISKEPSSRALSDERGELFLNISSLVFASLEKRTLLNEISSCLNKNFCDFCYVIFLNLDGSMEVASAEGSGKFPAPITKSLLDSLTNRDNKTGPANVLRTLQPELFNFQNAPLKENESIREEDVPNSYFHFLKALKMSSSICLPLTGHDEAVGCLGLLRSAPMESFNQEEFVVAEEVSKPVSLAIQNALYHQKIIESEQKLSTIANAVPVPLAYIDQLERVTFANANFLETFDLISANWEMKTLREIFPANLVEKIKPRLKKVFAGYEESFEATFTNSSLRSLDLEIKLVPKLDSKGQGGWFLMFIQDMTEIKRNQIILEKSKEAAQAANIAKSQFLANMSHEIRTPLGSMMGFAEMIKYYGEDLTTVKQWSKKILSCGNHLLEIINNVLDLAKVEADKIETKVENLNFKTFIKELEDSFPENRDVKLSFFFAPEVPSVFKSDKTMLRQILFNIIGNALKFTEQGLVKVTINFQKDGSFLDIDVRDTGCGITPKQSKKLFQPFSQLDSSHQRKHEGSGLGLALSQKMAKTLGGDVTLKESEKGRGSTFNIKVKVEKTQEREDFPKANSLSREKSAREEFALLGKKIDKLQGALIYIIDDSEDFRFLLSSFFTMLGANIKGFSSGEKALQALSGRKPDLVFLDLQMPLMDGYAVKEKLCKANFQGPIIACTANAMKEDREKAALAGFSDYVTKPVEMETLINTTIRHLQEANGIS